MVNKIIGLLLGLLLSNTAFAQQGEQHKHHDHQRADIFGPIGLMGAHSHHAGQLMFSYRFMAMQMDGNLDGTKSIDDSVVLDDFMVSPTRMNMRIHMFGAMYSPLDLLTITLMLPYVEKSMDHVTRTGGTFTTESSGIGDLKLSSLLTLWHQHRHSVHASAGLSLPTGSINARDTTPMGPNQQLPYPMQIGGGTVNALGGLTYRGQALRWSWGGQFNADIPLHNNANSYRWGEELDVSLWLSYLWSRWLSSSVRLQESIRYNIHGADPALNASVIPTADPNRRGGSMLDILFGLDALVLHGFFDGLSVAIEGGLPIYQSLDGPQLGTDWLLTTGVRYQF